MCVTLWSINKQNADGSYTLADTEQPIDEIGKTVTATPKTYAGYTYNPNAAGTVASGTLIAISNPDDIVTLKLYYDRTAYPVTVETDGNGTALASPGFCSGRNAHHPDRCAEQRLSL